MDYRFDDFKTRVRTIARLDSSTDTTTLLSAYINDIIKDFVDQVDTAELLTTIDITTGSGQYVEFSATPTFNTYGVIDIRDPDGSGRYINIVPVNIFDKAQINQTSSTGYPQVAIPVNNHKFAVWPYGNSTVWQVRYKADHIDFTADSQTMTLPDTAFRVICDKVVAEMLDWKDDNRAQIYHSKYERGMKAIKASQKNDYIDLRMQPTTNNQSPNASWERIFGDPYASY